MLVQLNRPYDYAANTCLNFVVDDNISHAIVDHDPLLYSGEFTHFKLIEWDQVEAA